MSDEEDIMDRGAVRQAVTKIGCRITPRALRGAIHDGDEHGDALPSTQRNGVYIHIYIFIYIYIYVYMYIYIYIHIYTY